MSARWLCLLLSVCRLHGSLCSLVGNESTSRRQLVWTGHSQSSRCPRKGATGLRWRPVQINWTKRPAPRMHPTVCNGIRAPHINHNATLHTKCPTVGASLGLSLTATWHRRHNALLLRIVTFAFALLTFTTLSFTKGTRGSIRANGAARQRLSLLFSRPFHAAPCQ